MQSIKIKIVMNQPNLNDSNLAPISDVLGKLNGNDREKIFKNIDIFTMYDKKLNNARRVHNIWQIFYDIYNYIRSSNVLSNQLKFRTRQLMELFLEEYHKIHVTPYMHALVNHAHEMFNEENLHLFVNEGVEKFNDLSNQAYFDHTNKKQSTEQMLLRRSRIERHESINIQVFRIK